MSLLKSWLKKRKSAKNSETSANYSTMPVIKLTHDSDIGLYSTLTVNNHVVNNNCFNNNKISSNGFSTTNGKMLENKPASVKNGFVLSTNNKLVENHAANSVKNGLQDGFHKDMKHSGNSNGFYVQKQQENVDVLSTATDKKNLTTTNHKQFSILGNGNKYCVANGGGAASNANVVSHINCNNNKQQNSSSKNNKISNYFVRHFSISDRKNKAQNSYSGTSANSPALLTFSNGSAATKNYCNNNNNNNNSVLMNDRCETTKNIVGHNNCRNNVYNSDDKGQQQNGGITVIDHHQHHGHYYHLDENHHDDENDKHDHDHDHEQHHDQENKKIMMMTKPNLSPKSSLQKTYDELERALRLLADDFQPLVARSTPKNYDIRALSTAAECNTSIVSDDAKSHRSQLFDQKSMQHCIFEQPVYDNMLDESLKTVQMLKANLDSIANQVQKNNSSSTPTANFTI